MTNSADPDQLVSSKPTGLDLHCLQRQGIFGFSRTRVNAVLCFLLLFFFFSGGKDLKRGILPCEQSMDQSKNMLYVEINT